jgi:catechol 2,3-dioxygenase-like lactoylglutathione lyase family enzyme
LNVRHCWDAPFSRSVQGGHSLGWPNAPTTVTRFKHSVSGTLYCFGRAAGAELDWRSSRPAAEQHVKPQMTIQGVSHLTFIVRNVDRTSELFRLALGASEVYDSGDRQFSVSREKFLLLGGVWLAFMQGEPVGRSYRHVAFAVDEDELELYERRLISAGVEVMPPRPRVEGEGRSVYFYDFDDNLFELHSGTLQERLERYAR